MIPNQEPVPVVFTSNPALQAIADRIFAGLREYDAAWASAEQACGDAARGMAGLAEALLAGERAEIAAHPDLAELNVTLDGFYA